jgi:hypothetical protein
MSAPDARAGDGPTAWFERAAVPGLPDTAASAPARSRDEEPAAIALRAEQIGIPGWRVMVALGLPLPRPPAPR